MTVDLNTLVQGASLALVLGIGRTLWRTVSVVERLDERTTQHGERIETLEKRVA